VTAQIGVALRDVMRLGLAGGWAGSAEFCYIRPIGQMDLASKAKSKKEI
jgi:hypothetical protein